MRLTTFAKLIGVGVVNDRTSWDHKEEGFLSIKLNEDEMFDVNTDIECMRTFSGLVGKYIKLTVENATDEEHEANMLDVRG